MVKNYQGVVGEGTLKILDGILAGSLKADAIRILAEVTEMTEEQAEIAVNNYISYREIK